MWKHGHGIYRKKNQKINDDCPLIIIRLKFHFNDDDYKQQQQLDDYDVFFPF